MLDASATVQVSVERISWQDCRHLEALISEWAKQRRDQSVQEYGLNAQLMRGSLQLDVTRLINEGVLTWQDTLAPVLETEHATSGRFEELEVTQYDRGTTELLGPAAVDNSHLLPGGAAAAKRRQLAQAAVGDWVDGAVLEPSGEQPGRKRQRLSMNKCHNCGSYGHGVSTCLLPINQDRVRAATAEQRAERSQGSRDPMHLLRVRYFEMPEAKRGNAEREAAPQPGQISAELAAALDMPSSTAPPPWLSRMVVLGLPPRYADQEDDDNADADDIMVFYRGSEDESTPSDTPAGPAGSQQSAGEPADGGAAAAADGAAAAAGRSSSSSSSGNDDGFIPFDDAAGDAGDEEVQQPGGSEIEHVQPAELPAEQQPGMQEQEQQTGQQRQQQQQQQQQQQHGPGNPPAMNVADQQGAQAPGTAGNAVRQQAQMILPGVNGDPPPNADASAWEQAMRNAAWLRAQLA